MKLEGLVDLRTVEAGVVLGRGWRTVGACISYSWQVKSNAADMAWFWYLIGKREKWLTRRCLNLRSGKIHCKERI